MLCASCGRFRCAAVLDFDDTDARWGGAARLTIEQRGTYSYRARRGASSLVSESELSVP